MLRQLSSPEEAAWLGDATERAGSPRERRLRVAADEALEELRPRFDDDASIDSGIDRLHSEIMWQSGIRELAQQHRIPWQPEIGDHAAWGHDRDPVTAGWAKC